MLEEILNKLYFQKAHFVWDYFECKNFGDYHDLYLKMDVLLLADVFENFRSQIWKDYNLEALYYFGAPGLTGDILLKQTYKISSPKQ